MVRKPAKQQKPEIQHKSLQVKFECPDSGWIHFKCLPLTQIVSATCYHDPFPDLIIWLEAIVDEVPLTRWSIGEEGGISDFLWSNAHYQGFDRVDPQLIHLRCGSPWQGQLKPQLLPAPTAMTCSAEDVVAGFYLPFREMVEHADFSPREWVSNVDAGGYRDVDILGKPWEELEDHPNWKSWPSGWGGTDLRLLRSYKIEAYLAGRFADQRQLSIPWG
jgi:hypothetical protein